MTLKHLLEDLFLPPGGPLLLALAGALLCRQRGGRPLLWTGLALAWLSATPLVGDNLLAARQQVPPLTEPPPAQAIVVLTAGRLYQAPEYGGRDEPDRLTLERLRYAARLHHETGLPVLVSGGVPEGDGREPLARLAARALRRDLNVRRVWEEGRSLTTWENARESARLLQARGLRRILLVTHAWHMPRAVHAFRRAGLEVVPAPTAFVHGAGDKLRDYLPQAYALHHSYWALHEWLGLLAYRMR